MHLLFSMRGYAGFGLSGVRTNDDCGVFCLLLSCGIYCIPCCSQALDLGFCLSMLFGRATVFLPALALEVFLKT